MINWATAAAAGLLGLLWAASASADIRLTETEIVSKLLFNSARIEDLELHQVTLYFPSREQTRGFQQLKKFQGSWSIVDDSLCLELPLPSFAGCWGIFLRGDAFFLHKPDGLPAGRIYFIEGNPHDL